MKARSIPPAARVRERPILFRDEMVRAILDGRKTETRRVIKPQPICNGFGKPGEDTGWEIPCYQDEYPPSAMLWPGENGGWLNADAGHPWCAAEQLWVKETHAFYSLNYEDLGTWHPSDREVCCHYREGCPVELAKRFDKWRPSIFMPRWASRIALEILDVTAEPLHTITDDDAKAEGVDGVFYHADGGVVPHTAGAYRKAFERLWDKIHGPLSFMEKNPWVWVIKFRRIT